jgi:hypothetical protein
MLPKMKIRQMLIYLITHSTRVYCTFFTASVTLMPYFVKHSINLGLVTVRCFVLLNRIMITVATMSSKEMAALNLDAK